MLTDVSLKENHDQTIWDLEKTGTKLPFNLTGGSGTAYRGGVAATGRGGGDASHLAAASPDGLEAARILYGGGVRRAKPLLRFGRECTWLEARVYRDMRAAAALGRRGAASWSPGVAQTTEASGGASPSESNRERIGA